MIRLLPAGGTALVMVGVGLTFPALVVWVGQGTIPRLGWVILSLAAVLALCGSGAVLLGLRRPDGAAMPAPVRAVVAGNILFVACCAMETSDRLLRQDGRIGYWTTVAFAPAILLLCGLLTARRWAWWVARGFSALIVLWCIAVLAVLPVADLRGNGGPIRWWGRIYVAGVTLVFAGIAAYVFRSLGRVEVKGHFRVLGKVECGGHANA